MKNPKQFRNPNAGLMKEVTNAWNAKIPKQGQETIVFETLSLLLTDLGGLVDREVQATVKKTVESQSLETLIKSRSTLANPQMYGSADVYFASSVLLSLFAKTTRPITGFDPMATARKRFYEAEMLCRNANKRFRHHRQFDFANRPQTKRASVHQIFHLARKKIASWIGSVEDCESAMVPRFGPGGVIGLKRPFTTAYYKFSCEAQTCSSGVYWRSVKHILKSNAWMRALEIEAAAERGQTTLLVLTDLERVHLVDSRIKIANYNKVTYVPKDAKTLRAISIEPSLNVMFQLGVGGYFKKCLQRAGCDLSDQSRNQQLAYVGSIQHESTDPVTLDLSMASDTLSIEVVRELLPCEWFEFLDGLRSHNWEQDGKIGRWEKFSSMGNGFTFELESMIFYALAQACSDYTGTTQWFSDTFGPEYKYSYVSVFGDDIIIPQNVTESLLNILHFCGFRLNLDKSFLSGPFRESCGEDYWLGVPVRPLFYDRRLSHVRDIISLHNGLKVMEEKLNVELTLTLFFLRSCLPTCVERHLRGTNKTLDDAYIWVTPDEMHLSRLVVWSTGWQRWKLPYIAWSNPSFNGRIHFRYVQFLYQRVDMEPELSREFVAGKLDHLHPPVKGSASDVTQSGVGKPTLRWW